MSKLIEFMVPFLKFGAIFISGISGILALLVDFKDKHNKITKWGRIALTGTVVSFFIAAIMQGIELRQNRQAAAADQQKTQRLLNEISRGIYNINPSQITFEIRAEIEINDPYFANYNKKLLRAFNLYNHDPKLKLPKNTQADFLTDTNGKDNLQGFFIDPGSPYYPDKKTDPGVFALIGQLCLDIKVQKFDTLKHQLLSKPSLDFSTETVMPKIEFNLRTNTVEIYFADLKVDRLDYSWRNKGDIQSLTDLSQSKINFGYSDRINNDLNDEGSKLLKKLRITTFAFTVNDRIFSSGHLCRNDSDYLSYYLNMPKDVLQTHLNINCGEVPLPVIAVKPGK